MSDLTLRGLSIDLETGSAGAPRKRSSFFKTRHTSLRCPSSQTISKEKPATPKRKTTKVFGETLDSLLEREQSGSETQVTVPAIVYYTVELLRRKALEESGLFRLCGKHSELISKQAAIDGGEKITEEFIASLDIHTAADLLKSFLRSLPSPIIPEREFYAHFLVGSEIQDEELFKDYLSALLKWIPQNNFNLLKYLCEFFHTFTKYYQINKMGATNLAIIFAPSFFGQTESTDSMALVLETKATSKITRSFIECYEEIFEHERKPTISKMIAKECFSNEKLTLLKGEDVVVLNMNNENQTCYIQLNGRLVEVDTALIESKCKHTTTFEESLSTLEDDVATIRERALQKLSNPQTNALHAQCVIRLPDNTPGKRQQQQANKKKMARNRKSTDIFFSIVKLRDTEKSHTDSKVIPLEPVGRRASANNGIIEDVQDDATGDKKGKTKKKQSKEAHKRINSTITAWYGAPTTRSSQSFFGNSLTVPSLGRPRRGSFGKREDKKERDEKKEKEKEEKKEKEREEKEKEREEKESKRPLSPRGENSSSSCDSPVLKVRSKHRKRPSDPFLPAQ